MSKRGRCIGLVKEVYNKWERRVPLTPSHVKKLVDQGVRVVVQPSTRRCFDDQEYVDVGAELNEDLSEASVIFGVKQVPVKSLLPDRTFVFFSHTIKAQQENMPLLQAIRDRNIRLVDYECITETGRRDGRRLITFGNFAGKAGMINLFRGLGERLLSLKPGYSSPFLNVGSAFMYPSLEHAKDAVRAMGQRIAEHGVPADMAPFTVVFTGNGNVSKGAQEIFELVPHEWVTPEQLPHLPKNRNVIYACVADVEHTVTRKPHAPPGPMFDYFTKPELFAPIFHEKVAPYASAIMNCVYWDSRYPRLMTKDQMAELDASGASRLLAVGDISCDTEGSLEFLTKTTHIEQPFYLYDPKTRTTSDVLDGDGVLMMGVDILPSELPRESSGYFGESLMDFVEPLLAAHADNGPIELPVSLQGAVITEEGKLAPQYAYIEPLARQQNRSSLNATLSSDTAGSALLRVKGHLFDTGIINQILNVLEAEQANFLLRDTQCEVNAGHNRTSQVIIQVSFQGRGGLDQTLSKLRSLCALTPLCNATIEELPFSVHKGDFSATLSPPQEEDDEVPLMHEQLVSHTDQKNIVVLGAGLVAGPLVEYLSRDPNQFVTVLSAVEGQASALVTQCAPGRANVEGRPCDVLKYIDSPQMDALLQQSDVAVSLLPASMHVPVAESCIAARTPLVTASYAGDMHKLDSAARELGLPILVEMGLDPGMDHMSAMKMIDEITAEGGVVEEFSSVCGGLPAPEAADNPLAYKFSWSPMGVLSAASNPSRYLKNGAEVCVEGEELLTTAEPIDLLRSLALEVLPNRDAFIYKELYGLTDAKSVFRGTLRYDGWSEIMYGFKQLGLLNSDNEAWQSASPATWDQAFLTVCPGGVQEALARLGPAGPRVVECLQWLQVLSPSPVPVLSSCPNMRHAFCDLLEHKLPYGPEERDMVLMQHRFGIRHADGRRERRESFLIAYGNERETIMSRTVGLTAAIGAQLVVSGAVSIPGVVMPSHREVYMPALQRLEAEGIVFTDTTTML